MTLLVALGLVLLTTPALLRLGSEYVLRMVVQRIERQTGRHLALNDIALTWVGDRLELRIASPRLSQPGQTADSFVAAREVRLYARWRTLLAGPWVLDGVAIDGLRLNLRRTTDGQLDFADLWVNQGGGRAFRLEALALSDARIDWQDEARGERLALVLSELHAGPLSRMPGGRIHLAGLSAQGELAGASLPAALALRVDLADLHAAAPHWALERLNVAAQWPQDAALVRLTFDHLARDEHRLLIRMAHLAGHYRAGQHKLSGQLSGQVHTGGGQWQLDRLLGELTLNDPRLPQALPLAGRLNWENQTGRLAGEIRSRYQDAALSGHFDLQRQSLRLRFGLDIEHFDLDRWRSVDDASGRSTATIPGWLADLTLDGRIEVGRLRVAGIEAERIRLHLQGRPGRWLLRQQRSDG